MSCDLLQLIVIGIFLLSWRHAKGQSCGHPGRVWRGHAEGTVVSQRRRRAGHQHAALTALAPWPSSCPASVERRNWKAWFNFSQDGTLHVLVTIPAESLSSNLSSLPSRRSFITLKDGPQWPRNTHACSTHTLSSQPYGTSWPLASSDLCLGESTLLTSVALPTYNPSW